MTGAGETIQTLNETIEVGTVLGDSASLASGFGEANFIYSGATYIGGIAGCEAGIIH